MDILVGATAFISVVENVLQVLGKSIALAFVLSQISTNCKSFVSNMDRTVTYMIQQEMKKSIVPDMSVN